MVNVGKYTSPMDPTGDDGRKADTGQFWGVFELGWDSFNQCTNRSQRGTTHIIRKGIPNMARVACVVDVVL